MNRFGPLAGFGRVDADAGGRMHVDIVLGHRADGPLVGSRPEGMDEHRRELGRTSLDNGQVVS